MDEALAPEDLLRLQVLLAQDVKAVRLDEANLVLVALTAQGEAQVPLHPTCRPDRYLRLVRELLSGHALGSPGGYPVFLSRWTRHGQLESENLGRLLLIGEPEAVVAVVHSPALTDEIARYAWWAMPTIEHARLMLRRETVARGEMGRVLTDFLVEHLPFLQDDHVAILDTVAVLLAAGRMDEVQRQAVWRRGKRSNTYYVPFLELSADDLPPPHAHARPVPPEVEQLAAQGNRAAAMLKRAYGSMGQTWLAAAAEVLERPETQEVVNRLFNALGAHFRPAGARPDEPLPDLEAARAACPQQAAEWAALAALAATSEAQLTPIFARTSAIGSLMRRKIAPLTEPLKAHICTLRGQAAG
ncbi:MAG: hypothetical protein N2Z63_07420 [Thiobacillaceae bacterium]|nr:hypothetical protein [Thiobacillaceae bacterium]